MVWTTVSVEPPLSLLLKNVSDTVKLPELFGAGPYPLSLPFSKKWQFEGLHVALEDVMAVPPTVTCTYAELLKFPHDRTENVTVPTASLNPQW